MKINIPIVRIAFILICILFTKNVVAQKFAEFDIKVVNKNNKIITGVQVSVFQNDSLIFVSKTPKNGISEIKLSANANYRMEFGGHDGWVKKKIRVLTFGLKEVIDFHLIEVELFKYLSLIHI